ncbi:MAG: alpha amylase C-terminal domain-containing protein, partial [Burkholderiales bacterium]
SLEWWVLQYPEHGGLMQWLADLNRVYTTEPALHEVDNEPQGFEWIDCCDWEGSTLSFLRKGRDEKDVVLVACNFTPVARENYLVGVPRAGFWRELLNSDASIYGGSGRGNFGGVESHPVPAHGRYHAIRITLPPLAVVYFKHER